MLYNTIKDVFEARRKGVALNIIIDALLQTPRVWEEHLTPFSLIHNLQEGDYVDMSTPTWRSLPVQNQIQLARGYQQWYAHRCGLTDSRCMLTESVNIKMVLIPPMKYLMGASAKDLGRSFDDRQTLVLVEKPFWMGRYEITQGQWLKFLVKRSKLPCE